MKKVIIVFIAVFCINNLMFSQDFYAGLKVGLKTEIYNTTHQGGLMMYDYQYRYPPILRFPMDISAPTLQTVFRIKFPSNWEIETGVGWYHYSQKLKAKVSRGGAVYMGVLIDDLPSSYTVLPTAKEPIYGSVNLSEKVGYRFNLSSNLHLRLNTGLQFGILYNARLTSSTLVDADPYELYIIYRGLKKTPINLLISNTISLQYTTKSNMYFSIFMSYHAGLFDVHKSDVYITNRKSSQEGGCFYEGYDFHTHSALTTKGSYFEFGIELGYMWKKKKLEP